jgi:hypothetical protein
LARNEILKWGVILTNVLVIGLLVYLLANIVTIPLVKPADGAYTTERRPEFVWGGLQRDFVVFLDDNPDFASAFTAKAAGNAFRFVNDLDFGTYYWKVQSGMFSSGVGKFTVSSKVSLSRREGEVRNTGNVGLVLSRITGSFVLGVDDSLEVEENEDVEAEQV